MIETYTIRIREQKYKSEIEKSYKECQDYYNSKNSFLLDCLRRGASSAKKEIFGFAQGQDLNVSELYQEIAKTVETLNQLIRLSEQNAKENLAHLMVSEKMLSCNYNMLLGLSENQPAKTNLVESGNLDTMPARFKLILKDMLDKLKKVKQ